MHDRDLHIGRNQDAHTTRRDRQRRIGGAGHRVRYRWRIRDNVMADVDQLGLFSVSENEDDEPPVDLGLG